MRSLRSAYARLCAQPVHVKGAAAVADLLLTLLVLGALSKVLPPLAWGLAAWLAVSLTGVFWFAALFHTETRP